MSSERAHSLQQLAAGSAVLSEASQLSAAAQQCIARAEQAAQMALLARAEAARLSGTALPLQTALHTASAPTADSSDHAAVSPAALSVNDPASATMTRQLTTEVSTSQPAVCSSDHATATDLGAPCDPEIAADIVDMLSMQLPNLGLSANVFLPSSPQQKSAAQLVQSLSADMRAAMQQLLASAPSASDSDMHGGPRAAAVYPNVRGSDASSPRDMQQQHLSTEASQVKHQSHAFVGSGLLDFHANGAELQSHDLPEQAAQSLPYLAQPDVGKIPSSSTPQQQQQQSIPGRIHAKHAVPWSSFRLPKQASRVESDEEVMRGFSGMELHLIHQLEGLERSVQRVEEQVSSNKQTRRLLKAVSTPAQVTTFAHVNKSWHICVCLSSDLISVLLVNVKGKSSSTSCIGVYPI